MSVERLGAARTAELRARPLTYEGVGGSVGDPPAGYRYVTGTRRVPSTLGFDELAHAVLTWQVQARAGLRVAASSLEIEPGAVVELRLGVGALAVRIPCRVVAVFDEPDRRGFAYGTLPGHPESGEEAFVVQRRAGGTTELTVSAFSRPASRLARLGGPVTTQVQRLMTGRYLRALD